MDTLLERLEVAADDRSYLVKIRLSDADPGQAARIVNAWIEGYLSSRTAAREDATAGVEAGRAGGFGCVVGVDRVDHADALREHGANIVVQDLDELLQGSGS